MFSAGVVGAAPPLPLTVMPCLMSDAEPMELALGEFMSSIFANGAKRFVELPELPLALLPAVVVAAARAFAAAVLSDRSVGSFLLVNRPPMQD